MCKFCDALKKEKDEKLKPGWKMKFHVDLVAEAFYEGVHKSYSRKNSHFNLRYCPECGKELSQLMACPFCDQEVAKVEEDPYKVYVVCNYHEGGCGATSGYHHSKEEAIEAWNRRGGK